MIHTLRSNQQEQAVLIAFISQIEAVPARLDLEAMHRGIRFAL